MYILQQKYRIEFAMQCLRMFLSDIIGDLLEYAREGGCVPPRSSMFHSFSQHLQTYRMQMNALLYRCAS